MVDSFLLTPIAIKYYGAEEANPYQRIGWERYGLKYFYISIFPFTLVLFVMIKGVEKLCDDYMEKDKWYTYLPLHIFFFTWILLMTHTIINNIGVILG